jgi:hypothetical protein
MSSSVTPVKPIHDGDTDRLDEHARRAFPVAAAPTSEAT